MQRRARDCRRQYRRFHERRRRRFERGVVEQRWLDGFSGMRHPGVFVQSTVRSPDLRRRCGACLHTAERWGHVSEWLDALLYVQQLALTKNGLPPRALHQSAAILHQHSRELRQFGNVRLSANDDLQRQR